MDDLLQNVQYHIRASARGSAKIQRMGRKGTSGYINYGSLHQPHVQYAHIRAKYDSLENQFRCISSNLLSLHCQ